VNAALPTMPIGEKRLMQLAESAQCHHTITVRPIP
jgi:hypothetical protein